MKEEYRTEVKSVRAFVQRVACEVVNRGYVFYLTGHVPEGRDPEAMERKLDELYGYKLSKHQRLRRKRKGLASLHLVRYGRFYAMFATPGKHEWFEGEEWPREVRLKRGRRVKDLRLEPLRFEGYQIGVRRSQRDGKEHVSVRIQKEEFEGLRAYFLELACSRNIENLRWELSTIPFEPYSGVKRQFWKIIREMNGLRKTQGLEPLPLSAARMTRKVVKTFEDVGLVGQVAPPATGHEEFQCAA